MNPWDNDPEAVTATAPWEADPEAGAAPWDNDPPTDPAELDTWRRDNRLADASTIAIQDVRALQPGLQLKQEPLPPLQSPGIQTPPANITAAGATGMVQDLYRLERQARDAENSAMGATGLEQFGIDPAATALREANEAVGMQRRNLMAAGLTAEDIDTRLADTRALDFSAETRGMPRARTLSDGSVVVDPALAFDPAAWDAAVDGSNATDARKEDAKAYRVQLRDGLSEQAWRRLWEASPEFQTMLREQSATKTTGEIVEEFKRTHSGRFDNLWQQISIGLQQGERQLAKSAVGALDMLAFDQIPDSVAQGFESGVQYNAARRAELGGGQWAGDLASTVVGTAPSIAVGGITRNFPAMLATAGGQTAGDTYATAKAAGWSPLEAAGAAIVQGGIDAGITAAFGKTGIESLAAGQSEKGLLRRVVTEGAQEVPEEVAITLFQAPMNEAIQPGSSADLPKQLFDTAWQSFAIGGGVAALNGKPSEKPAKPTTETTAAEPAAPGAETFDMEALRSELKAIAFEDGGDVGGEAPAPKEPTIWKPAAETPAAPPSPVAPDEAFARATSFPRGLLPFVTPEEAGAVMAEKEGQMQLVAVQSLMRKASERQRAASPTVSEAPTQDAAAQPATEGQSPIGPDVAAQIAGDPVAEIGGSTDRSFVDSSFFQTPGYMYRVVVGDAAFNDVVNSGLVRTNSGSKDKGTDLSSSILARPTAFPSFSKDSAAMSYAGQNPNNYIIVSDDPSIKASKQGRHGKGTTHFPTDINGNPVSSLSGEKVKIYKHVGNGNYALVYENGKLVTENASTTESALPESATPFADKQADPIYEGAVHERETELLRRLASKRRETRENAERELMSRKGLPWTNQPEQAQETARLTAELQARVSEREARWQNEADALAEDAGIEITADNIPFSQQKIDAEPIAKAVRETMELLGVGPDVVTAEVVPDVESIEDINARKAATASKKAGNNIRAYYLAGKNGQPSRVVVNAAGVRTPEAARIATLHEVAGHHGLRVLFTKAQGKWRGIVDRLYNRLSSGELSQDVQRETGVKTLRELQELYHRPDVGMNYDPSTPEGRSNLIEEVLATMAPFAKKPSWYQSILAELKTLLNRITGGLLGRSFTDADVNALLARARKAAKGTGNAGGKAFGARASYEANGQTKITEASNGTVVGPAMFSIRAYHGTPHTVDKFTTEKIGTGEGAQVYGWGLYFAENPAVAEEYRKNLGEAKVELDGNRVDENTLKVALGEKYGNRYLDGVITASGLIDRWIRESEQGTHFAPRVDTGERGELLKELDSRVKVAGRGNTYTVELDVEPDDLLDWDKPLSEQSEKVKAALAKIGIPINALTGAQFYKAFSPGDSVPYPAQQSAYLLRLGIKGIRYLDQGSRPIKKRILQPDGSWKTAELRDDATRNYVVFNEADIQITERNGQPVTQDTGIRFSQQSAKASDAAYLDAVKRGDMETAQRMVDAARLKPRNVFYVGKAEIIRNPTNRDYLQIKDEHRAEYPHDRLGETTRFTTDKNGNRYIWRADYGMHGLIEPGIESRENVKVGQNEFNWNRQAADPVTYDDAGNVIPLSQRFNESTPDIRFSQQSESAEREARSVQRAMEASANELKEFQTQQKAKKDEKVPDAVKSALNGVYAIYTDVQALRDAQAWLDKDGADAVEQTLRGQNRAQLDKRDVAAAKLLLQRHSAMGLNARYTDLLRSVMEKMNTQAQGMQAMHLLFDTTTPEGALAHFQREVEKVVDQLSQKNREQAKIIQGLLGMLEQFKADAATSRIVMALRTIATSADLTPARKTEISDKMRTALINDDGTDTTRVRLRGLFIAAGVETKQADAMAVQLLKRFRHAQKRVRAQVIKSILKVPAMKKRIPKGDFAKWERLNEEGTLSDAKMFASIANRFGFPVFTSEDAATIRGFFDRYKATNEPLLKFVQAAKLMEWIESRTNPAGIMDKLGTLYKLTKLMSFKVIERNLIGNIAAAIARTAGIDVPLWLGEKGLSLFTGKRVAPLQTAIESMFKGQAEVNRMYRIGRDYAVTQGETGAAAIRAGFDALLTAARYHMSGYRDATSLKNIHRSVFTSAAGKMFEKVMHAVITLPDLSRFYGEVNAELARLMAAAGPGVVMPTAEMYEAAYLHAMREIYQGKNQLTDAVESIVRGANKLTGSEKFGLGTIIAPFVRVPVNILKEGATWSPLGVIRALYNAGIDKDPRRAVQNAMKAVVGTAGLIPAGAWLYGLGIISAALDEDKEIADVQRASGMQRYAINLSMLNRRRMSGNWHTREDAQDGDVIVSYAWAQPMAFSLAAGAEMQRRHDKGITGEDPWWSRKLAQPAGAGLASFLEQPLVTGVSAFSNDLTQAKQTGDYSTLARLPIRALDFVPAIVRDIRYFNDNALPETKSADVIAGEASRIIGGVPFVNLAQRYNVLGEAEERYQAASNTLLNTFFNPAMTTFVRKHPVGQEVLRLAEATGDKSVAPGQAGKSVTINTTGISGNAQKLELNNQDISKLQALQGKLFVELAKLEMTRPNYFQMTDYERARSMSEAVAASQTAAKFVLFGHLPWSKSPSGTSLNKDAIRAIAIGKAAGVIP